MKKIWLIPILFVFLMSCHQEAEKEKLITVSGEIPVEETGITLIHEHTMVDWIGADSTGYHRWDRSEVVERVLPFLKEAQEKGVNTFFDCTPAYLGRDPYVLKELSERTGMNIVTNTGYYGAVNDKFVPEHAFEDTPAEIAKVWIEEFKNGIDGGDIRPGFIKIGVDTRDTLSSIDARLIKAAAIAHKATGLTIVSHTGPNTPAFAQIKVLKNRGVSPEAFVWTHAQQGTMEGYIRAARQGAWISLDNIQKTSPKKSDKQGRIAWFVDRLSQLKEEGLLNKVLLSHDAGWYTPGEANGGDFRGYTDLFEHLIPALKENGFTREEMDQLLVKNPRKAYAVQVRTTD
jgi:phosphotriesterase-related protein